MYHHSGEGYHSMDYRVIKSCKNGKLVLRKLLVSRLEKI